MACSSATLVLGIALGVGGGLVFGCKPSGDDSANGSAGAAGAAGGVTQGGAGGAAPAPSGGAGMVSAGTGGSVATGVSGGANDGGVLSEAGTPDADAGDAAPPMTDCTTVPAPKCSITISGLPTGDGTYDCSSPAEAFYTPTGQMVTSVSAAYSGNSIQVMFGPAFPGDIHTGTFSSDSADAAGLIRLIQGSSGLLGGTQWVANPANPTVRAKGDYAMTITCFSLLETSKGVVYYTVQGSITAHLLPATGTGTDAVTVEATF